jgi:hypothetical protein
MVTLKILGDGYTFCEDSIHPWENTYGEQTGHILQKATSYHEDGGYVGLCSIQVGNITIQNIPYVVGDMLNNKLVLDGYYAEAYEAAKEGKIAYLPGVSYETVQDPAFCDNEGKLHFGKMQNDITITFQKAKPWTEFGYSIHNTTGIVSDISTEAVTADTQAVYDIEKQVAGTQAALEERVREARKSIASIFTTFFPASALSLSDIHTPEIHTAKLLFTNELLVLHQQAAYQGRCRAGIMDEFGDEDLQIGLAEAKFDYKFIDKFFDAIKELRYFDSGYGWDIPRMLARAYLYTYRAVGTANKTFLLASPAHHKWEWVYGGNEEHCPDCIKLAQMSPWEAEALPTVPGSGQTKCLWHCQCLLKRDDGATAYSVNQFLALADSTLEQLAMDALPPNKQGEHWIMVHGHAIHIENKPINQGHIKAAVQKHNLNSHVQSNLNKAYKSGAIKTDLHMYHAIGMAAAHHEHAASLKGNIAGTNVGGGSIKAALEHGSAEALAEKAKTDPHAAAVHKLFTGMLHGEDPSQAASVGAENGQGSSGTENGAGASSEATEGEADLSSPAEKEKAFGANAKEQANKPFEHWVTIDGKKILIDDSKADKGMVKQAVGQFEMNSYCQSYLNNAVTTGKIKTQADLMQTIAIAKSNNAVMSKEAGSKVGGGSMLEALKHVTHAQLTENAKGGGKAAAVLQHLEQTHNDFAANEKAEQANAPQNPGTVKPPEGWTEAKSGAQWQSQVVEGIQAKVAQHPNGGFDVWTTGAHNGYGMSDQEHFTSQSAAFTYAQETLEALSASASVKAPEGFTASSVPGAFITDKGNAVFYEDGKWVAQTVDSDGSSFTHIFKDANNAFSAVTAHENLMAYMEGQANKTKAATEAVEEVTEDYSIKNVQTATNAPEANYPHSTVTGADPSPEVPPTEKFVTVNGKKTKGLDSSWVNAETLEKLADKYGIDEYLPELQDMHTEGMFSDAGTFAQSMAICEAYNKSKGTEGVDFDALDKCIMKAGLTKFSDLTATITGSFSDEQKQLAKDIMLHLGAQDIVKMDLVSALPEGWTKDPAYNNYDYHTTEGYSLVYKTEEGKWTGLITSKGDLAPDIPEFDTMGEALAFAKLNTPGDILPPKPEEPLSIPDGWNKSAYTEDAYYATTPWGGASSVQKGNNGYMAYVENADYKKSTGEFDTMQEAMDFAHKSLMQATAEWQQSVIKPEDVPPGWKIDPSTGAYKYSDGTFDHFISYSNVSGQWELKSLSKDGGISSITYPNAFDAFGAISKPDEKLPEHWIHIGETGGVKVFNNGTTAGTVVSSNDADYVYWNANSLSDSNKTSGQQILDVSDYPNVKAAEQAAIEKVQDWHDQSVGADAHDPNAMSPDWQNDAGSTWHSLVKGGYKASVTDTIHGSPASYAIFKLDENGQPSEQVGDGGMTGTLEEAKQKAQAVLQSVIASQPKTSETEGSAEPVVKASIPEGTMGSTLAAKGYKPGVWNKYKGDNNDLFYTAYKDGEIHLTEDGGFVHVMKYGNDWKGTGYGPDGHQKYHFYATTKAKAQEKAANHPVMKLSKDTLGEAVAKKEKVTGMMHSPTTGEAVHIKLKDEVHHLPLTKASAANIKSTAAKYALTDAGKQILSDVFEKTQPKTVGDMFQTLTLGKFSKSVSGGDQDKAVYDMEYYKDFAGLKAAADHGDEHATELLAHAKNYTNFFDEAPGNSYKAAEKGEHWGKTDGGDLKYEAGNGDSVVIMKLYGGHKVYVDKGGSHTIIHAGSLADAVEKAESSGAVPVGMTYKGIPTGTKQGVKNGTATDLNPGTGTGDTPGSPIGGPVPDGWNDVGSASEPKYTKSFGGNIHLVKSTEDGKWVYAGIGQENSQPYNTAQEAFAAAEQSAGSQPTYTQSNNVPEPQSPNNGYVAPEDKFHVSIGGQKVEAENHDQGSNQFDVEAAAQKYGLSDYAKNKLKSKIDSGTIKTVGEALQTVSIAEAYSKVNGVMDKVTGTSMKVADDYVTINKLKEAAKNGDSVAAQIVNSGYLGEHNEPASMPEGQLFKGNLPAQFHNPISGQKETLVEGTANDKPLTTSLAKQMANTYGVTSKAMENTIMPALQSGKLKTTGQLQQACLIAAGVKHDMKIQAPGLNNFALYVAVEENNASIKQLMSKAEGGDALATKIMDAVAPGSVPMFKEEPDGPATGENILAKKEANGNGTAEGGWYVGEDGKKRYVKKYKDDAQAYCEHLTNQIYKSLGIQAADSVVFKHGGKVHYASKSVDSIGTYNQLGMTQDQARQFLDGFAADILTGNHDVVGAGSENPKANLLQKNDGSYVRLDNGGSLLFKGMSGRKPEATLDQISEWDHYTQPGGANKTYQEIFAKSGLKKPEELGGALIQQIDGIVKLRDKSGGWDEFVDQHVPGMKASDKAAVVKSLEAKTSLLQMKKASIEKWVQENATWTPEKWAQIQHNFKDYSSNYSTAFTHFASVLKKQKDFANTDQKYRSAFAHWQGGGYRDLNEKLRGVSSTPLTSTQQSVVKNLDEVFEHASSKAKEDFVVYRGLELNQYGKHIDGYDLYASGQPGSEIVDPGYNATSLRKESTSGFTGYNEPCIMRIHVPKDTHVAHVKNITGANVCSEYEILMARNSRYVITGRKKIGNTVHLDVMLVVPDKWKAK